MMGASNSRHVTRSWRSKRKNTKSCVMLTSIHVKPNNDYDNIPAQKTINHSLKSRGCDGLSRIDYADCGTSLRQKEYGSDRNLPQVCGTGGVQHMIDSFMPLIVKSVQVRDILPHLPFIDSSEFMDRTDQVEAMTVLIKRLFESNEPGKWQTFLHSLSIAEYEYIERLLRGHTEEDHTVQRQLLKIFTPEIIKRIEPDDFLDLLFEKNVINDRDMQEVKFEKERRGATAASFMLLEKVPRRASNWFDVFIDVLKKCGMKELVYNFHDMETPVTDTSQEKCCLTPEMKKYASRPLPPPPSSRFEEKYNGESTCADASECAALEERCSELEVLQQKKAELQKVLRDKSRINAEKLEIMKLTTQLKCLDEGFVELELLRQKKTELQKTLRDKSMVKNEKMEIVQLMAQLKSLDEEIEHIENPELQRSSHRKVKFDKETLTDVIEQNEVEHVTGPRVTNDEVLQLIGLFTEQIACLKDHVADIVLKTLTFSADLGSPRSTWNTGFDIGHNWNMEDNPSKLKLYTASKPTPHVMFDSAICTDYYVRDPPSAYHVANRDLSDFSKIHL